MTALLHHRCRFAIPMLGGIGDVYLSDGLGSTYLLQVILVDTIPSLSMAEGETGYTPAIKALDALGFGRDLYVELVDGQPTIAIDPTLHSGSFQPLLINGYTISVVTIDGQDVLNVA